MAEHPITPPPELVERLRSEAPHGIRDAGVTRELHLITTAYRAGADQELEACCEWVGDGCEVLARDLRSARRPKPPSLKEQALNELQASLNKCYLKGSAAEIIRRALEQLDD